MNYITCEICSDTSDRCTYCRAIDSAKCSKHSAILKTQDNKVVCNNCSKKHIFNKAGNQIERADILSNFPVLKL